MRIHKLQSIYFDSFDDFSNSYNLQLTSCLNSIESFPVLNMGEEND